MMDRKHMLRPVCDASSRARPARQGEKELGEQLNCCAARERRIAELNCHGAAGVILRRRLGGVGGCVWWWEGLSPHRRDKTSGSRSRFSSLTGQQGRRWVGGLLIRLFKPCLMLPDGMPCQA